MSDITPKPFSSSEPIAHPAFKDLTGLAGIVRILFAISVVCLLATAVMNGNELMALKQAKDGLTTYEENYSTARAFFDLGSGLLLIMTAVFFLVWVFRSNKNARALGTQGMKYSPGWSVGWFFVPVASIIMPGKVLQELWNASQYSSEDWSSKPSDRTVLLWWGLWGASSALEQRMFVKSLTAETVNELYNAAIFTVVVDVLDIFLCLVSFILVGKISELQTNRARTIA